MNKVTKPFEEEKPSKNAPVGKRIDYIRRKKGLSQKELGKAVGVEDKTIKRYENNKTNISLDMIKKIAVALDVTTDYLLGVSDIESFDKNMEIVHKTTGLSNNAIKVLMELYEQDNTLHSIDKTHKRLIDTISFLIEQEKSFPITTFSCSSPLEKDFEEAEKQYNEQEAKWDERHSYILSTIHNFFVAEVDEEEIHIKDSSMKYIFGKALEDYLPKTIVLKQDIVNREYLLKIQSKLKKLKQKYKKGVERRK